MSMSGAHYIVAVDPGVTGVACRMDLNSFAAEFFPLPSISYQRRVRRPDGTARELKCRRIDEAGLIKLVRTLAVPSTAMIVLEHQAPFPGQQSVTSTGKLLYVYGLLRGAIMTMPIQLVCVKPRDWKKALALIGKRKDPKLTQYAKKKKAYQRCVEIFPEMREQLVPMTSNFDKCESLLLCYYGAQFIAPGMGLVSA